MLTMARTTEGICRICQTEQGFVYEGRRGHVCRACWTRHETNQKREVIEARKVLCPSCHENRIDPVRNQFCVHCSSVVRCTLAGRGRPIFHKATKYWIVHLPTSDPYFPMANSNSYVRVHRLVMAEHVGRCLTSSEVVHHRNHDKTDNRLENLQLMTWAEHRAEHEEDRLRAHREKCPPTYVDETELRRLHAVPGMRVDEMATLLGVTRGVVQYRLKVWGLRFKNGFPSRAELALRTDADPPVPERLR